MKKITANTVEICVANLLSYRRHVIVPNVSWGLGLRHECDMLVLDDANRFTEVEIKVTRSDLRADFTKAHQHESKYISRLIYALPQYLSKSYDLIPPHCGIIEIRERDYGHGVIGHYAVWHRQCRHRKDRQAPPPEVIRKFMELGCMRIWTLKEHLKAAKNNRKPLIKPTT